MSRASCYWVPKTKPSIKDNISSFDVLPQRERLFSYIKNAIHSFASFYGFELMKTSVVEDPRVIVSLFKSGLLDLRPPFICKTKKGTELALSPSPVISILRAYSSHKMNDLPHPIKFIFDGQGYFVESRGDFPLNSAEETGFVIIGEDSPIAESEVIEILCKSLEELGIGASSLELRVNAIGCVDCRSSFRSSFSSHFRSRIQRLCRNCKRNFKRAPQKILECSEEKCRTVSSGAPQVLDFLCESCRTHLGGTIEFFDEYKIPYFLDSKFFKEGSWYDTFIFELAYLEKETAEKEAGEEGKSIKPLRLVVAEGGRLSRAGEIITGRKIDAVALCIQAQQLEKLFAGKVQELEKSAKPKVFLVQLGDLAKRKSFAIMENLRLGQILSREALGRDSIKSQLRLAEVVGAEIALIVGQKEALDGTVIVRELGSGIQETVPQEKLVEFLKRKLKK